MNSLDPETRARIITALVEGCSIASSSRMTGAKMTVLGLLREVGTACQRYHDAQVRLESDPAHAKPPLYSPHEWLLEEAGESLLHAGDLDGLLQLLPEASVAQGTNSGAGGAPHRSTAGRRATYSRSTCG